MPEVNSADTIVHNERVVPFSPSKVFAAFRQPELLAQWWGPNGFSNTFERFEFKDGGVWDFVMHGPDGANYQNECTFQEVRPDEKIVIKHLSQPPFTLAITLTPQDDGTHVSWAQQFESAEMAAKIRSFCEPANEENLNRLEVVLGGKTP